MALNVKRQILQVGRYCIVRLGDKPLHVSHVLPSLMIISDNLKTCVWCFSLSDRTGVMSQMFFMCRNGRSIRPQKGAIATTVSSTQHEKTGGTRRPSRSTGRAICPLARTFLKSITRSFRMQASSSPGAAGQTPRGSAS